MTLTDKEARLEMDHQDVTMGRRTKVCMAVVSLSLVVCACGAVAPPSGSSPNPAATFASAAPATATAAPASATTAPTSATAAAPTSVDASVASLVLTIKEYAAALSRLGNAKRAARVTDAEVVGQAGTDQREFFASDGSPLAAVQLYVQNSVAATDEGYSSLLSNSCPPGGHTTSTYPKIGTAKRTDEFRCHANGTIQVAFEQGLFIGAFVTSPASGAEALARAESSKLQAETVPAASPTPSALAAGSE